jgi:hypothetical protein
VTAACATAFWVISGKKQIKTAETAVTAVHQAGGNSSQIFSEMTGINKSLFAGKILLTENNIIGELCGNSLNPCWH